MQTYRMTYFHVLGVGLQASDEDVRKAYVSLARQWHPDAKVFKNKRIDRKAVQKFQAINNAYHHLRTQPQREAYIRMLRKKLKENQTNMNPQEVDNHAKPNSGKWAIFFLALKEVLWPFVPKKSSSLVALDREANYV